MRNDGFSHIPLSLKFHFSLCLPVTHLHVRSQAAARLRILGVLLWNHRLRRLQPGGLQKYSREDSSSTGGDWGWQWGVILDELYGPFLPFQEKTLFCYKCY